VQSPRLCFGRALFTNGDVFTLHHTVDRIRVINRNLVRTGKFTPDHWVAPKSSQGSLEMEEEDQERWNQKNGRAG
jgi:hypothetical protein